MLSTRRARPRRRAIAARPGRSASRSSGFETASTKIARVLVRESRLHGGRLRGVREAHADPPARGLLPEERGRRAVEILSHHEVLAGPETAQQERAQRGHPRGDDEPGLAALEGRQRVLQDGVVRRPEAPVHVPRLAPLPDGVDLRQVLEDVYVRQVDRGNERLRGRFRWRRRPSGPRREAQPGAHGRPRSMPTPPWRASTGRRCATSGFRRDSRYLARIIGDSLSLLCADRATRTLSCSDVTGSMKNLGPSRH